MNTKRRGYRRLGTTPEPRNKANIESQHFTPDMIDKLHKDLKTRRIPLDRVMISDDRSVGLKVLVRGTGVITFLVNYSVAGGGRYNITVGHYPEDADTETKQNAIDQARELSETIRSLAAKGIDVQEGLHARLIRELQEQGTKWRP
jgi:hypothetical protein